MILDAGRVHFIGIGGAGMSAIAKVLIERGVTVSGSDLKQTRVTAVLEAMGAKVTIGHDGAAVEGADVVVASAAIPVHNVERRRAEEIGLSVVTRGEALAEIIGRHPSIVVAGTHGKTTTTSMIVSILRSEGRDPTYLVGGGLNDVGTNARSGRDDLVVAESDESDGSFLLLEPTIAVVTNVEADHLDHWGSAAAIRKAFGSFLEHVRAGGVAIVPTSDDELRRSAATGAPRTITFGEDGDVRAEGAEIGPMGARFTLVTADEKAGVELAVGGAHNVSNALAAAAACLRVGLDLDRVARGLARFRGVERRFQMRGLARGVTVVDDYAHHPTEVRATLQTARLGSWERVVAVFQPHLYSRTMALRTEFGAAFDDADRIVITDVYAAREEPVPGVTGKLIADAVCARLPRRAVAYLPHRADVVSYLEATARGGDLVLTLGAGDVNSVGDELLARLGEAT
ncbi:MAG: UDP-N-acetylmuramate--L-alanine ligase [Actinomycetota bacterium]